MPIQSCWFRAKIKSLRSLIHWTHRPRKTPRATSSQLMELRPCPRSKSLKATVRMPSLPKTKRRPPLSQSLQLSRLLRPPALSLLFLLVNGCKPTAKTCSLSIQWIKPTISCTLTLRRLKSVCLGQHRMLRRLPLSESSNCSAQGGFGHIQCDGYFVNEHVSALL